MPSHRVLLELTARYNEPHRHYHTIRHVAWMLHLGRDLGLTTDQILGIWFHDAVYGVPSDTNEEDSAALAARWLGSEGYPESGILTVQQIVLDTKTHLPTVEPSALVIDLDLSSLAAPREVFVANTEKLRLEYAQFTREEFDHGRLGFLEKFLDRDRIFCTDWGARFEADARRNLELDRELLSG